MCFYNKEQSHVILMALFCNLALSLLKGTKQIWKCEQGLALHKNHTKGQQGSPLLYCVSSITKCLQLEIPVGSPSLKDRIRVLWQSPTQAFWESSAALKFSIIGRISPPSVHSESAAEAAAMSRWHHSEHFRAQHEQHAVLIFLLHTARQSSSTRLGAVNCLQMHPSPHCLEFYQMSLCGKKSCGKTKFAPLWRVWN